MALGNGVLNDQREQIQRAFEKLDRRQRAHDFQQVAYQLLREEYPELIAPEWTRDAGEDAFSIASVHSDGKRRSLACSLTATLTKVEKDCREILKLSPDLEELLFATPKKVGRRDWLDWGRHLASSLGVHLVVFSKNSLVSLLERPSNHWIGREYLGLDLPAEQALDEVEARLRVSAQERLRAWEVQFSYVPDRVIDLGFATDKELRIGNKEILIKLARGARFGIRGPGGTGKTFTLLRFANSLLKSTSRIPLLVSLPVWAQEAGGLVSYLADSFRISADEVVQLDRSGKLCLLLNGWNEVPTRLRGDAEPRLVDGLARLPRTSALVASRDLPASPSTGQKLTVLPLTRSERNRLIEGAGLEDSDGLQRRLSDEARLDRLTLNPLFLSIAIRLWFTGAELSASPYSLVRSFVDEIETGPEHATHLGAGARGQHRRYLERVAAATTDAGGSFISKESAVELVAETSQELQALGLISAPPDAVSLLDCLVDHHLLIRPSEQVSLVGFQHEAFQEWFAGEDLYRRLHARKEDDETEVWFQAEVLNQPDWTEPLRLLMDRLGGDDSQLAARLVRWSVSVDLALACDLADSEAVRSEEGALEDLQKHLCSLLSSESPEASAFAASLILRSGLPGFESELWRRIESTEAGGAKDLLRSSVLLRPEAFGAGFETRLLTLAPEHRRAFYFSLARWAGEDQSEKLHALLKVEPEGSLLLGGAARLAEVGRHDLVEDLLGGLGSEAWRNPDSVQLVRALSYSSSTLFVTEIAEVVDEIDDEHQLEEFLDYLAKAGSPLALERTKAAVLGRPRRQVPVQWIVRLQPHEPEWVSDWIWESALAAEIPSWVSEFEPFRLSDERSRVLAEKLFEVTEISSSTSAQLQFLYRFDPVLVAEILTRLSIEHAEDLEFQHSLSAFWMEFEAAPLIESILRLKDLVDSAPKVDAVLQLVSARATRQERSLRSQITLDQAEGMSQCLEAWAELLNPSSDPVHEGIMASLALVFGRVAKPSKAARIQGWIDAVASRDQEELEKTGRPTRIDWSNQYAAALGFLEGPAAFSALVERLQDPRYLGAASATLAQPPFVQKRPHVFDSSLRYLEIPPTSGGIPAPPELGEWNTRDVATAIRTALDAFLDQAGSRLLPYPRDLDVACESLAKVGSSDSLPTIVRVCRGGRASPYSMASSLESYVQRGGRLPALEVLPIVEGVVAEANADRWRSPDERWSPAVRCACAAVFSDDPLQAISTLESLYPHYSGRSLSGKVVSALAGAKLFEGMTLLRRLLTDERSYPWVVDRLLAAFGRYGDRDALESLLDVASADLRNRIPGRALARTIGEMVGSDTSLLEVLRERSAEPADNRLLPLLVTALMEVGSRKAGLELARLIETTPVRQVNRHEFVETFFQRKVPLSSGGYLLEPRACNALRAYLYRLISTGSTRAARISRLLLTSLELDRQETGRPAGEPRHPSIGDLVRDTDPWLVSVFRES